MNLQLFIILASAVAFFVGLHLWKRRKPYYRKTMKPWSINWSLGFPASPEMTAAGWRVKFPSGPHRLGSIQWYSAPKLREGQMLTVKLRVTGGPFVFVENPSLPASMGVLLQRKQDNMISPYYRYINQKEIPLVTGDHTVTIPVSLEGFADSLGGMKGEYVKPITFQQFLDELESIGIVFGGPGGRAHGVSGQEGAVIELLELGVG